MSVYTEKYLKEKLTKELDAVHVEVVDESDGCGGKFSVLVVSDKFQGKPPLARHRFVWNQPANDRLVNSVLQEELKSIHAFSQKTLTVDQWKSQ